MKALWRIIRYGAQGFRRNVWLSIIAIITMTMTLTTMTVFAVADIVATNQYQQLNSKVDYIIFLKDAASETDAQSFVDQLRLRPEVTTLVYLSKDQVLTKFTAQFGGNDQLKAAVSLDNNPLPREIDARFHDPQQISSFDSFVSNARFDQIREATSYNQDNKNTIDNYLRATNIIRLVGIFFTGFFVLIAIMVILNTIRLAIFARRDEIEVMRLVGATRGYIRGPFLIEGTLFGLLGALFSGLIFWVILHQLQVVLANSAKYGTGNSVTDMLSSSFSGIVTTGGFNMLFLEIVGAQLVVGIILGIICSYAAARRYLRE